MAGRPSALGRRRYGVRGGLRLVGRGDHARLDGFRVGDVVQRGGQNLTVGGLRDMVGSGWRLVVAASALVDVSALGVGEQGGGLVLLARAVGALAVGERLAYGPLLGTQVIGVDAVAVAQL